MKIFNNRYSLIKIYKPVFLFLLLLAPLVTHGSLEESFDFVDNDIRTEAGVKDIGDAPSFIEEVIRIGMTAVAIIAVGVLVYGGFLYITAAGNEDQAKKAKMLVAYAVIGLLLIGVAAIVVNVVIGLYSEP